MKLRHWRSTIRATGACIDARKWLRSQESAEKAWHSCERGDWLLWIAARLLTDDAGRKLVVLAACDCAETALVHVPAGEERPRLCIDAVRAWTRGEATIEEVRDRRGAAYAAYAAYAAAPDEPAATSAAAYAAYAAYAADAAYAAYAAYAAAYAADAADAAAYAADAADAAAARKAHLAKLAGVVRTRIAWGVVKVALRVRQREVSRG
jgi:hypothetical protein